MGRAQRNPQCLLSIHERPIRVKLLFIGAADSTHTQGWIDLFGDSGIERRLFAYPPAIPTFDMDFVTDIPVADSTTLFKANTTTLRFPPWPQRINQVIKRRLSVGIDEEAFQRHQLARVVNQWKPDIVHALGLYPSGFFYGDVLSNGDLKRKPKWTIQIRGGSDLAFNRFKEEEVNRMRPLFDSCDAVLSDNEANYVYLRELFDFNKKRSPVSPLPGSGGVDVESLNALRAGPPSQRRLIVWPKAYSCVWSVGSTVLEALKLAWNRIQPCDLLFSTTDAEMREWVSALPDVMRRRIVMRERISKTELLKAMADARILMAPSLVDGVPNVLYEAMACGALPIVSPLETITPVVQAEENCLFARNLYPDEIADALVRAMTDDELVDSVAQRNLELVKRIADRKTIAPKIIEFYNELAAS